MNFLWFVNRSTLLWCIISMVQLSLFLGNSQALWACVHDQLNFCDWPVKHKEHWEFAPFYSLGFWIELGLNSSSLLTESNIIPQDQWRSPEPLLISRFSTDRWLLNVAPASSRGSFPKKWINCHMVRHFEMTKSSHTDNRCSNNLPAVTPKSLNT